MKHVHDDGKLQFTFKMRNAKLIGSTNKFEMSSGFSHFHIICLLISVFTKCHHLKIPRNENPRTAKNLLLTITQINTCKLQFMYLVDNLN
jgi:hypothetical protein